MTLLPPGVGAKASAARAWPCLLGPRAASGDLFAVEARRLLRGKLARIESNGGQPVQQPVPRALAGQRGVFAQGVSLPGGWGQCVEVCGYRRRQGREEVSMGKSFPKRFTPRTIKFMIVVLL